MYSISRLEWPASFFSLPGALIHMFECRHPCPRPLSNSDLRENPAHKGWGCDKVANLRAKRQSQLCKGFCSAEEIPHSGPSKHTTGMHSNDEWEWPGSHGCSREVPWCVQDMYGRDEGAGSNLIGRIDMPRVWTSSMKTFKHSRQSACPHLSQSPDPPAASQVPGSSGPSATARVATLLLDPSFH